MEKDLLARKRRLSREFLGRDGLHGVGARKGEETIIAYVSGAPNDKQVALLETLRQAAAPFGLEVVREVAPRIQKKKT